MTNQPIEFAWESPLGSVSFGQTSFAILREMRQRGLAPNVFPIGGNIDLSTQKPDEGFNRWLNECVNKGQREHDRKKTAIRLWHPQGSLTSHSKTDARLITFMESSDPTTTEINILRNQDKVYVTNRYIQGILRMYGVESEYLPLGFDAHNFGVLPERPGVKDAISTLLVGKLEHRKHTLRQIALWAKRYGNKKEYRLNASVFNPFMKTEHQQAMIHQALEGKSYWNITFLPFMATNAEYSQYLQSGQIVLACSGSEGFGLGEFHATAMGAWPVVLHAHAYKDTYNESNAVLIKPNGMIPIYDNIHFAQGQPFGQGNIFTFSDEDWYAGVEEAHKRAAAGLNTAGYALQKQTYSQAVDILLKDLK